MRTTTSLMLSLALAAGAAAPLAASSIDRDARGIARASEGQKPKPKPSKPAKPEKAEKAKEKGEDKRAEKRDAQARGTAGRERVFDRDEHVRVIRDYERRGLPPGLAKREQLPPGLRRQLRERGTLPPGLQKRLVEVPAEWSDRLPALGRYERRYFAGNDLIVIDTRTNTIVAYIRDILR